MEQEKDIILSVENISKQYRLGEIGTGTLSHDLKRWWFKIRGKEDPFLKIGETNNRSEKGDSDYVWALKDISFEVGRGEVLGIIGKNGAGKSTLLKILSKVTGPTTGTIKSRGRIASLLEVGTGFHPELTGRENIYLNGAILGMTRNEIAQKIDDIIEFSGCQRYIDTPTKRYSSGMTVRLAFAVAAFLEPEILIVDEVLAVGDAEFQKKALGKMQDISKGEGRTVLFVSHNMAAVKSLCTRGVLLEYGMIKMVGSIEDIVQEYQLISNEDTSYKVAASEKPIYIQSANIVGDNNNFYAEAPIKFRFDVDYNIQFTAHKYLLVRVMDMFDQVLFSSEVELKMEQKEYELEIPGQTLVKGSYKLNLIIYHPAVTQYDVVKECCGFNILDNIKAFSHLETFDIGRTYKQLNWK